MNDLNKNLLDSDFDLSKILKNIKKIDSAKDSDYDDYN